MSEPDVEGRLGTGGKILFTLVLVGLFLVSLAQRI